jgi:hypothetical protein
LVVTSFCRWGHPSVRRLGASSKYGMAVTVSRSLAVGEGDEEDVDIVLLICRLLMQTRLSWTLRRYRSSF